MSVEVVVDDKGRLLIPSKLRKRLKIKPGQKVKLEIQGGRLIIVPVLPRARKVRAGREWGEEAFLDAGEATFGEEGVGR